MQRQRTNGTERGIAQCYPSEGRIELDLYLEPKDGATEGVREHTKRIIPPSTARPVQPSNLNKVVTG